MSAQDSKNLFWDACVICRWLTETPVDLVDHIELFIKEAEANKRKIYLSTISFTEIRPSLLKKKGYGTVPELIAAFKSAFVPIDTTPDISAWSGQLRDIQFKKDTGKRQVGLGDALQLMTAVYVREELGVSDLIFHTLDEGKGKNWEGKCVPLLGFEDWCTGVDDHPVVKRVIDLPRSKPEHPAPKFI